MSENPATRRVDWMAVAELIVRAGYNVGAASLMVAAAMDAERQVKKAQQEAA